MTENQISRHSKRKFSVEEKRTYYIAWKNSGYSLTDFCKSQGISRSALYNWSNQFKKENIQSDFSQVTMPTKSSATNLTQLTIHSCDSNNTLQLKISIPEHRLVSFIKEMCNATSVIR
jgi:transposase-like protein